MKKKAADNSNTQRTGTTIIEFLTAGALLATVISFLAPFISRVSIVNESIADREHVHREVQNIVTQIQQGEQEPALSEELTSRLEDAKLEFKETFDTDASLTMITVSISWINQFGEPHPPVSLSFWQPKEESE